jgi:glycosidase
MKRPLVDSVLRPVSLLLATALAACASGQVQQTTDAGGDAGNGSSGPFVYVDSGHFTTTSSGTSHAGDGGQRLDGAHPTDAPRSGMDAPGVDGSVEGGGVDGSHPGSDAAVPTTCPETFTLPDNGYTTVNLETDYEMWTTAIPMTKSGSAWSVTTPVPYGKDVEYKFVADGTWMVNPAQPAISLPSISDGTNTNNILQAITCGGVAPGALQLVGGNVTTGASSYSFQVKYVPGGAPIDASKTVVTLNGAPVPASAAPFDASSETFSISVSSGVTSPNKYGYVFEVEDTAGNVSRLFVPFWIGAGSWEWNDAFMYEVMIDRFLAGGTSKQGPNGPPTAQTVGGASGDWLGGDFGGVTQKIADGYFDQMGVNALWISSPVLGTKLCEDGTGANTGYCIAGYHSYFPIATGWTYGSENDPLFTTNGVTDPIDPHFGLAADLVTLVNTAHQHGIRVLTDLVVNHVFADSSPPSGQSPQRGPLAIAHQSDIAWFNTPYSASVNDCGNENLWDTSESNTWNRADCWFDPYLPDLNTTSPSADDAIVNHAVWLMEQFNLDGFRVDAVKQVNNAMCSDLRSKITAAISTDLPFYMVGEALGSVEANVFDCVDPTTMLNGSMDDTLHNTIVGTVLQGDSSPEGAAQDLYNGVVADEGPNWTGSVQNALMGHFFGSHDTPRAISLAEGDSNGDPWSGAPPAQETNPAAFQHLELAQAFLLTYDSIPVLWMGDEFGQPGTVDPDCRRMMRFDSALSPLEQAALKNLQTLGKVRAAHSALRRGPRTNLWVDGVFYADGRVDGTDITVVALNLGTSTETRTMNVGNIGLTGTVTDALSGTAVTVAPGGGFASSLTITLPALTAAVFTQ